MIHRCKNCLEEHTYHDRPNSHGSLGAYHGEIENLDPYILSHTFHRMDCFETEK